MARPASLSLAMPKSTSAVSSTIASPTDVGSDSPSPVGAKTIHDGGVNVPMAKQPMNEAQPNSPDFTSLPPFPSSPKDIPKHTREPSKGFFSNLKASKSSNKVHHIEPTIRQVSEDTPRSNVDMNEDTIYLMRKGSGSTPDLSLSKTMDTSSVEDREVVPRHRLKPVTPGGYVPSSGRSDPIQSEPPRLKKPKPRLAGLLTRTRSMRMDDTGRKSKPATPVQTTGAEIRMQNEAPSEDEGHYTSPRTAPIRQENTYRNMMGSVARNRSADRQAPSNHSEEHMPIRRGEKGSTQGLSASASGGLRDQGGSHLFTNIKSKAADGLGKAGKGIFGKMARSGSSNVREEERYALMVINLPLVEQTRKTRIASRLADSRDKTEFWMPALPWRCIDFLNFKGCEEEGLYRVPGSDVQIRHWQKRFDQEFDIDLFEEPELYDINIVGSMFKAWLRELPTEILPNTVQVKIARECVGATTTPQLLKDELSSLPPWNYYLLFAITCHLSLLIACSEKNKMNYHNLCVCFQPALRMDNFCFQFLVQDWRNCWQGCWTEREALDEEYRVLDRELGLPSSGSGAGSARSSSPSSTAVVEERSLPSSSSHKPLPEERSLASSSSYNAISEERSLASSSGHMPLMGGGRIQHARPPPLTFTQPSQENLSTSETLSPSDSETVATPTTLGGQNGFTSTRTPLPELAPMLPLSPIVHHFS